MTEQSRITSIGSLDLSRHNGSQFPLSAAFLFAVQGIRLRLGRMALVFLGISLAMAFTGALLATDVLYRFIPPAAVEGQQSAQAFRWMWVGVALLISTSGTLNAILMSVTERIKEIGTLKCLGAKSIHIIQIFVFESALLGLLGGLVGGILGYRLRPRQLRDEHLQQVPVRRRPVAGRRDDPAVRGREHDAGVAGEHYPRAGGREDRAGQCNEV